MGMGRVSLRMRCSSGDVFGGRGFLGFGILLGLGVIVLRLVACKD